MRDIYKNILGVAEDIAKEKKGALFVLGEKEKLKRLYCPLFPQGIRLNISEKGAGKVIEKLATLDGAVLISNSGEVFAYGARLKKSKTLQGFGTRHAAAAGITSFTDSTAILVSEEAALIRVFRDGNVILEMDAKEKPKGLKNKILSFLTEEDNALLAAAGASAAVVGPSVFFGPVVAPVIIAGGSVYLAVKAVKKFLEK